MRDKDGKESCDSCKKPFYPEELEYVEDGQWGVVVCTKCREQIESPVFEAVQEEKKDKQLGLF